jgi:hypothetical protein
MLPFTANCWLQKYMCGKPSFSRLSSPGASFRVRATTPTIVVGGAFSSFDWCRSMFSPIGSLPGKY